MATTISIAKSALKTSIIEALYNEILTNSNNYYYFLGKTLPFGDADNVETPAITPVYEAQVRDEIIFMKKITTADISYIIPRYDWVANTVFDMYDDAITPTNLSTTEASSLETAKFYCMTPDYHVYKCIDNNGGAASTVQPYGTSYKLLELSDGYIWKYMYTVPVSSRNKFMTLYDIPVTTAIKNQYYSRGSITSATVLAYGNDYAAGDTLQVYGNGYLEASPLKVASTSINSGGTGYVTAPDITFSDAYANTAFALETEYLLGQYLKYENNIYEVVAAGTTDAAVYPTHTSSDIVYNGTCALKYVATTVTGTTSLTDDVVTSVTLNGIIGYVNMTNPGYGYTGNPAATISGDGSYGTGAAVVVGSRIVNVLITDRGTGYTTATVAFDTPMTEDSSWSSGGTVAVNDIIKTDDDNYYQVVSGTTLGTTKPSHTSGTATNGTTILEFVGAQATGSVELYYGYGYISTPTATVEAPGVGETASISVNTVNTSAKLVPIIENGQIISVVAQEPGIGYTTASIVPITSTGSGAQITANISFGDLNTNQANIELLATPGTVDAVVVTDGGIGYSYATITVNGDGTGATAEATIVGGSISKITMLTRGTGYTKATITITGDGTNAVARAIVSPVNGHGSNAVTELFAKDITFFSSISNEKNQGFSVANDYRQLGIIKNPQVFSSTLRLNTSTSSACYAVSVNSTGVTEIPNDSLITDEVGGTTGNKYRVVASVVGANTSQILIQSLDNAPITVAQNLYLANKTLTVTNFTNPGVNKYSGNLLFIDNRNAFLPSPQQTISIKTAIRL